MILTFIQPNADKKTQQGYNLSLSGSCLTPVEYDEEKSFEEMTFDELGDALSCPYNYALCIDSLVFESNGAFGNDKLVVVVG